MYPETVNPSESHLDLLWQDGHEGPEKISAIELGTCGAVRHKKTCEKSGSSLREDQRHDDILYEIALFF